MPGEEHDQQDPAGRWFHDHAEGFLRRVGVHDCLRVADVGCHNGHYTLPAAHIVGDCGKVYALDKDPAMLAQVREAVGSRHLRNVEVIEADLAGDRQPAVEAESIDLVLLYDMLHRGYLPEKPQRRKVLGHVYRMLRPGGTLSFFPTHLRGYRFTFAELFEEVAQVGFRMEDEHYRRLVHDGRLVRGRVFRFSKLAAG